MNPILLGRHVKEGLRELVHATLNTTSLAFNGSVERFLDAPANFIKGPWVSVDMPFRQIDGASGGNWTQSFPQVPLRFAPYQHQVEAFARLGGDKPRSTLVATGTGSGKTESYLWPILDHCRQQMGKPGIKAILIYPMNALATDQARRLASALTSVPALRGLRAGIYADAEPKNATHEVTEDSIITHRETMRRQPPDILLTNYKMLDYLLLRGLDRKLWQANTPTTLRFLVVDELHTFDGAQGADLALLLRRLKYRLRTPDDHLVCVGSSATLGAGADAATALRGYAETIFGERFDEGAVIRETRKTPGEVFREPEYFDRLSPQDVCSAVAEAENLDQAGAARRLTTCLFPEKGDPDLATLHAGNPTDASWRLLLGQRLLESNLCQRVLKIIHEAQRPVSLDEIAAALSQVKSLREWEPEAHRALAELVVSLIAWARSGTPQALRPLFNVRLQVWIREMGRMVASLPRTGADGSLKPVDLHHALDLDQLGLRRMLPVVNCNRCGSTAHIGRMHNASSSCWAPLDQIYEEFFDDRGGGELRLFYSESIERGVKLQGGKGQVVKGTLNSETVEFGVGNADGLGEGPVAPAWMYAPTDSNGNIDRTCPACGHAQGLLLFGMRAARLTAGITATLYTSAQNEEDPKAKPRFLMFSDSVQDAAHRAAVAETRNSLSVSQKSLFKALQASGNSGLTLKDVIEAVPQRYLDELGGEDFTAQFIAREQTWRSRYQDLVSNGTPISDPVFLEQVRTRLGWEYFVDVSYRAHFSHTLEANGLASADVPVDDLQPSAEKLSRQLHNEYPSAGVIDPKLLLIFLAGMLQRMRRQGSVAHPYVELATGGSDDRGLGWFAAAIKMGLGKTRTLPVPDHRRGLSPIPVSLGTGAAGFEDVARSHTSNWYRDWLFRTLGPASLQLGAATDVVYSTAFHRLEADAFVRRVNGPASGRRHGWLVDPGKISASAQVTTLVCTNCRRRETLLSRNAEVLDGMPCPRIGCLGQFKRSPAPPRPALVRSLSSDRNHRVVACEHTGLLETDQRLQVETGFIKGEARWSPNLISATPTLEMGIDIGDLSTMLLSSVPPEEANYVQRMGRSGRRDGNALNMVLATSRAHDLQFWEDPLPMLAAQVRPPGVFLAAEAVLLRQVTAFTLDDYVASTEDSTDYGKVREVLRRRRDNITTGFPVEWLDLVQKRGSALAEAFLSKLPQDVRERPEVSSRVREYLTTNGSHSIAWRIGAVFDEAASERARLIEKRDEVTREQERLRRRRAELTDQEFERLDADLANDKAEINRLIRTGIEDVSVLKFLTDKGVLPNYAFPEEGVKLTSILSRRSDGARDEDGLLYLEYMRPASSALTEFAPGQYFYANGRQVRIERLEIGTGDLSSWTFCQACSFVSPHHEGASSPTCPKCGDQMWADNGSRHEVVLLKSVISVDSEERAAIRDQDQRQQQQFDRAMVPSYGPEDISVSWFTREDAGTPFGFEFISHCAFRDFNFGRKTPMRIGPRIAGDLRPADPFRICRHCGTLQQVRGDGDGPGTHPPRCRAVTEKGMPRAKWETRVFLMRGFTTEAIRVVIPVIGDVDNDDIKSFVAGINLGMRRYFAGKVDHIRSAVVEAQLDGMTLVRSLFLYDSVPGGSGYLRQIGEHPETMRAIVQRAAEALRDCPCSRDGRTGCYRCVKSYRSQFGPGEPDRERARGLMEAILQKWDSLTRTESGIDDSIRGAMVESALEKRFLGALADAYGADALVPQVLSGGRRGFILKAGTQAAQRLWTIEPQVNVDTRFRGMPRKRVDFLLTPIGRSGAKPIVIEMDGIEYHADTVDRDLLDRLTMIRQGDVHVWTLAWKDLDAAPPAPLNPLDERVFDAGKSGRLGRVLAHPDLGTVAEEIKAVRSAGVFAMLMRVLDGETDGLPAACSVLLRSLIGSGQKLDDLPRIARVSTDGRLFLDVPGLAEHVADGGLDLYMACQQISPAAWKDQQDDIRLLLRGELPPPGETPSAREVYTNAWRGLWRLVNVFQGLRGLHVEIAGLDTLSPPDMSPGRGDQAGEGDVGAWGEARSLCDDLFHPLIDALVAAAVQGPDLFGDDIVHAGRVVGMMEFGWTKPRVAVAEHDPGNTDWTIITFDPSGDGLSDAVTKILKALERART
jgi:DEAD/DEAH box helicase domain-containing protein